MGKIRVGCIRFRDISQVLERKTNTQILERCKGLMLIILHDRSNLCLEEYTKVMQGSGIDSRTSSWVLEIGISFGRLWLWGTSLDPEGFGDGTLEGFWASPGGDLRMQFSESGRNM